MLRSSRETHRNARTARAGVPAVLAIAAAASVAAPGCGCPASTDSGTAADAASDAGDDAALDAASDAGTSVIGTACTAPDPADLQGSCPAGFLCAPFPGGYCTATCSGGGACSGGAVCAESARIGELCYTPCTGPADCRTGYACESRWGACAPADLLAPPAPACPPEPPLAVSAWGPMTQLSTPAGPGLYDMEPSAALNAGGDLTVLFNARREFYETSELVASTRFAGGTTDLDRPFASTLDQYFDVWLASDRTGTVHAVWLAFDGFGPTQSGMHIGHATSTNGIDWSAPAPVHDPSDCPTGGMECLDKPMIAVGPYAGDLAADAVYVSYFSTPAAGLRILRSLDGGASFDPPAGAGSGFYGDIEVSSDGAVHVVTVEPTAPFTDRFGDLDVRVSYRVSADGGTSFSPPSVVSDPTVPVPFYFSNPQVVPDPVGGRIYVAYPAGTPDGVWDIYLATTADAGATWTRIRVNDDPPCANHMTPSAALDPATGDVHVVWTENRGGAGGVAYARCAAGGATCSPNEAVTDVAFADYSFVRHSRKWHGEYNALVADTTRNELHFVWTHVIDEGGLPTSRIFHALAGL